MNHSIYSADKATHRKVVMFVLLTGIVIMATTLTARLPHLETDVQMKAVQAVHEPHSGSAVSEMARSEKRSI
ncbi:hypothetical protein [Bradyrhizobium amphicarpaeae]|nr:hypothetical protein [Bradyrhizobium amphicarpaeae]